MEGSGAGRTWGGAGYPRAEKWDSMWGAVPAKRQRPRQEHKGCMRRSIRKDGWCTVSTTVRFLCSQEGTNFLFIYCHYLFFESGTGRGICRHHEHHCAVPCRQGGTLYFLGGGGGRGGVGTTSRQLSADVKHVC